MKGPLTDFGIAVHNMATPPASQDYWHKLDFAWSFNEFESAINTTIVRNTIVPKVITLAIETFIYKRFTSAVQQLDNN